MDILEAINKRHAVRSYQDKPLSEDIKKSLKKEIEWCNKESGLNIKLFIDEPVSFNSFLARKMKFENVKNYIALSGKNDADLEEKSGYYGEHLVLKATQLGLNTCWVAMTFKRRKVRSMLNKDEKLTCVIALGYGTTDGVSHPVKSINEVSDVGGKKMPYWFKSGIEAALLAPSGMGRQNFMFTLLDDKVKAEMLGTLGSKVDLGIAKYHFEAAAGKDNFEWH